MDTFRRLISERTNKELSGFPDSITYGDLISINTFEELELSYFKGIQESTFRFIIRKFVGPPKATYDVFAEEIDLLYDDNLSYSEFFYGYLFEYHEVTIEYILITKISGESFRELANNKQESVKIEALKKLAQILLELQQKVIFNVCLNQDLIYITEKGIVLIVDLFWTRRYEQVRSIIDVIQLANDEFLAPELRFLKKNYGNILTVDEISLLSASIFSFGLLGLSLFRINASINLIEDSMIFNQDILKSLLESQEVLEISYNPSIKVSIKNRQLKNILSLCLEIFLKYRNDYGIISHYLNTIKFQQEKELEIKSKIHIKTEENIIAKNITEENITDDELNKACIHFTETMKVIHSIYGENIKKVKIISSKMYRKSKEPEITNHILLPQIEDSCEEVKTILVERVRNYVSSRRNEILEILQKGHDLFHASKCDSEEIKFNEGLVSFFYAFYKDMSNTPGCAEELFNIIIEENYLVPDYATSLNALKSYFALLLKSNTKFQIIKK
ncbi:hypothetical protein SteCoe_38143 [Stentor coeruleus]|uniref:Protein kinase domain-containing protein n=1 Tax=Stentor coeruleus TaxID=5963 RepID=A0A1R2ALR5_9CILI|nr:hypothetical protein SteCoe_38143 [Stentor coeruleus]